MEVDLQKSGEFKKNWFSAESYKKSKNTVSGYSIVVPSYTNYTMIMPDGYYQHTRITVQVRYNSG